MIKASSLKAEVTVHPKAKTLALIITLLDVLYINDVKSILRSLIAYYEVEL